MVKNGSLAFLFLLLATPLAPEASPWAKVQEEDGAAVGGFPTPGLRKAAAGLC